MAETKKETALPNETAAAIYELAKAMMAQAPKSPLENAGFSPEEIRALTEPGTPKKFRFIPCKSEDTGASFDAHVVESKSQANGRIVSLHNYKHPAGTYVYQSNGGKVPDGFPMWQDGRGVPVSMDGPEPPRQLLSPKFLQWRWVTFYQADLRRFVSKELKASFCVDEQNGLKTAWQAGKSAPAEAAAE